MDATWIVRGLAGGALVGLAATLVLLAHGRVAGISGILGRAPDADARAFRLPFLAGLIATGLLAAALVPSAIGAPVRGSAGLAIAGLLVGIGTTAGNGCTSGHGVCGLARGSRRSLAAVVVFMLAAAVTVLVAKAVR